MSVKRIFSYLFFLQVLALMILATTWGAESRDTLKVITPQWEDQTNADGSGLFFDILRAVYESEDIGLAYTFAPWKRCQAMVNAGNQDAMLCVWKSHARQNHQITTKMPLFVEETAVVVKKASGIIWKGIHSLDYKRAVWLRGYNYHQSSQMAGIQLADWYEVDAQEDAWHQLDLDRFDAYIDARIDIDGYLKSDRQNAGLYQIYPLWKQKAYVAFTDTKRSRRLIRIYDTRVKALIASGELARIHAKWGRAFDPADWAE